MRVEVPVASTTEVSPQVDCPMRPLLVVSVDPLCDEGSHTKRPAGVAMYTVLPTASTSSTTSVGRPLNVVMESIQSLVE